MPDSEPTGSTSLTEALGGTRCAVELTDDHATRLAELVTAARAQQRRDLRAAVDGGLSHIPKLLRGPIKKLVVR